MRMYSPAPACSEELFAYKMYHFPLIIKQGFSDWLDRSPIDFNLVKSENIVLLS